MPCVLTRLASSKGIRQPWKTKTTGIGSTANGQLRGCWFLSGLSVLGVEGNEDTPARLTTRLTTTSKHTCTLSLPYLMACSSCYAIKIEGRRCVCGYRLVGPLEQESLIDSGPLRQVFPFISLCLEPLNGLWWCPDDASLCFSFAGIIKTSCGGGGQGVSLTV